MRYQYIYVRRYCETVTTDSTRFTVGHVRWNNSIIMKTGANVRVLHILLSRAWWRYWNLSNAVRSPFKPSLIVVMFNRYATVLNAHEWMRKCAASPSLLADGVFWHIQRQRKIVRKNEILRCSCCRTTTNNNQHQREQTYTAGSGWCLLHADARLNYHELNLWR